MCRSTRYHKKCDARKMQRVNGEILHVSPVWIRHKQLSALMATSYSSPLSNGDQRLSVSHCCDACIFLYHQAPSCMDVDVRVTFLIKTEVKWAYGLGEVSLS